MEKVPIYYNKPSPKNSSRDTIPLNQEKHCAELRQLITYCEGYKNNKENPNRF